MFATVQLFEGSTIHVHTNIPTFLNFEYIVPQCTCKCIPFWFFMRTISTILVGVVAVTPMGEAECSTVRKSSHNIKTTKT